MLLGPLVSKSRGRRRAQRQRQEALATGRKAFPLSFLCAETGGGRAARFAARENRTVPLCALNVCGDGCPPFLGRTGKKAQRQVEEPQEVAPGCGLWGPALSRCARLPCSDFAKEVIQRLLTPDPASVSTLGAGRG